MASFAEVTAASHDVAPTSAKDATKQKVAPFAAASDPFHVIGRPDPDAEERAGLREGL